MLSYKSKELNIFSNDENYKLQIAESKVPVLGSNVVKIAYGMPEGKSGSGAVSGFQAVYIPLIATDINDMPQYIGDAILNLRNGLMAEAYTARTAESKNASDAKAAADANALSIAQEVSRASFEDSKHAADIASEILSREQADYQANLALSSESTARQASDSALSSLVSLNKGIFDGYVSVNDQTVLEVNQRITDNHMYYQQRFSNADSEIISTKRDLEEKISEIEENITTTQSSVTEEANRAQAIETSLQSQISNLLLNTDSVALNSLAELVADYRVNGTGVSASVGALEARVVFLEGVIAQLVAKVL